jgi:hypothetical protein
VHDRRAVADWEDGTRAMGGEGDVRDRRELWGREKMLWGEKNYGPFGLDI